MNSAKFLPCVQLWKLRVTVVESKCKDVCVCAVVKEVILKHLPYFTRKRIHFSHSHCS